MAVYVEDKYEVLMGDGICTVRSTKRSNPIVANILGVDRNASGEISVIYLDRLVHETYVQLMGGWIPSGAISTILTRPGSGTSTGVDE
jgi:hypothetical protein